MCVQITTAQPEQEFYSFDFTEPNDWTVENNAFGLTWDIPGGNSNCAIIGDGFCLHQEGANLIQRIIPTTGYHTIRIQIG